MAFSAYQHKRTISMPYSLERVINIWDDESGQHIYVGPDEDDFDLVELREIDSYNEITHRFTLTKECALAVAKAILELYRGKSDG